MTLLRIVLCCCVLSLAQLVRADTDAPTDAQFAFVSSVGVRTFWVSHTRWTGHTLRSRATWLNDDAAFAKVADQSLPESLRELAQQAVSIFDSKGKMLCQAELKSWGVLAEYDQGDDNWADLSKRALLKRMYARESHARRRYAVELKLPLSCARARWARAASLPPAAVFHVTAVAGKALLAERSSFRRTPEWAEAQTRFTKEKKGRWDEHVDTKVHAYSCEVMSERFLLATLFQFNDCESFSADVVLTFRGRGKQTVQLPNELSTEIAPQLALDLDLDGTPEWMTSEQLIAWDGERFSVVIDNAPLFSACPC